MHPHTQDTVGTLGPKNGYIHVRKHEGRGKQLDSDWKYQKYFIATRFTESPFNSSSMQEMR